MRCAQHPALYLAKLKVGSVDVRRQISAISDLPYPYDPLLEPELAGMTYYQVALFKQRYWSINSADRRDSIIESYFN